MEEMEQLKLELLRKEKQLIGERRRLLQSQLMILDYQEKEIDNAIDDYIIANTTPE